MKIRWAIAGATLIFIFLIGFVFKTNYRVQNSIPYPSSAKQIENNQIIIPFPYSEQFKYGLEQWLLVKDSTNQFVLKVLFKGKEVTSFPVKNEGENPSDGKIILDNKEFIVINITLHNSLNSGMILLQKKY
ncbi:hypothetical protein [Desulfitobacterium sp. AusDCA]|uniref:hypothetical protein n=1 Tax=Desulfitobacterium sp. AusDCA TaxID=3240383 RepID=UPI003DA721F4